MEEIIRILTPALSARMLTTDQREAFERGLTLLEQNPRAMSFVKESRRFRDYHRRVRQLLTYLQTLQTSRMEIKRHVGRPTKEEQALYAEQQKEKALEEARRSLFPDLKPDLTLQPLTYGGIVANPNGETIASTMPNLMQLRPFLSERLQEQVNTVRSLRNEMAAKAEQAKTMAEANEKAGRPIYTEEEIALLATRAVKIESDILPRIYINVDREIGEAYLRLSPRTGDPEYIARIEKACNVPPQNEPAIIPAMAQATATVMLPLPPASSESRIMRPVFLAVMPATLPVLVSRTSAEASQMVPTRLTAMEIRMAIAAENCSERMFAVTIQIRNTSGSSR